MIELTPEYPPIISIDLGTSNSCSAVYYKGEIKMIPNEIGENISPSYISFFDNDEKLIGIFGKERIIKDQKIIHNSKRLIGRRFEDKEIIEDMEHLPIKIIEDKEREKIKFKLEGLNNLTKNEYYPEEISAMILRKIKNDAESFLQMTIEKAVITTPAYFNQRQRMATKQAAEIAGLKIAKIINEPTAASIAYAYENKISGPKNLIFDFGGGTLDLTLLSYTRDPITNEIYCQILCSSGDTHCGGQDIDNRIQDLVMTKYEEKINTFFKEYGKMDIIVGKFRLLKACEKAKIQLSSQDKAIIQLNSFLPTINIDYILERTQLDEIIKKFFDDKIEKCLKDFLLKSKIQKNELDNLILVGGSSKIPKLKELIKNFFNSAKLKILSSIDPLEVVAKGAGIIAGQIKGEENLQHLKLLDVTSLSLGTNLKDGKMDIIIPKSSRFPTRKKKIYYTTSDNQEIISNKVYEGESEFYKDNYLLGDFNIINLTKREKGKTSIELEFELNKNLILTVIAKELNRQDNKENKTRDIVILEQPKSIFKLEDIEKMKNFIIFNDKTDWQSFYDGENQKEIIKLKEKLVTNNIDKYQTQMEIIKKIDNFLSKFDKEKIRPKQNDTNYKIYSLYIVFFFHEINNLFKYKTNFTKNDIDKIIDEFKLENKLEIINSRIDEIIWEILDIVDSNELFYNSLKLIIIDILSSINIEYKLYQILDFSIDISLKLKEYKKIISDIKLNLLEYKSILNGITIEDLEKEKKLLLLKNENYWNILEVKKYILSYYINKDEFLNNHENITEYKKFMDNLPFYNIELDSPEYIKLKEIYKNFQSKISEKEIIDYLKIYKEIINGRYHADDDSHYDNKSGYTFSCEQEEDVISDILKTKESIKKKIERLHSYYDYETFLHKILYEFPKNEKNYKVDKIIKGDSLFDNAIPLHLRVISIYQENKEPKTMREFKMLIRDDCIVQELNSIFDS